MSTPEAPINATIIRRDWSFQRRGLQDQERHKKKVKEVIKESLPTVISDGSIITADPGSKRIIKVPLRSLEIPHIRYKDDGRGVGSGQAGKGEAGSQPGIEYYEAELTIGEIQEMVFEQLGLPNLKQKKNQNIESETEVFDDVRKNRSPDNLDIMRTLLENIKRNARETGRAEIKDISPDDYRKRAHRSEIKHDNNAALIFMADLSISVTPEQRYMIQAFCWWAFEFLRTKYRKVDTAFIVHNVVAVETTEEQFLTRGVSGGTLCSAANALSLNLIKTRYFPDSYNTYPMHFTDGENQSFDNPTCVSLVQEMLDLQINQYGYIQLGKESQGDLMDKYKENIKDDRFVTTTMLSRDDVWPALKKIFSPDKAA